MESEISFQSKAIGILNETGFRAEVMSLTSPQAGVAIDAPADSAPLRDQRLVRAAQSGCRNAFDELISLYSKRVRRTILGITKNPEDAEDVMQDTFLRAFMAIGRFEGRASFYSWLTRIAINSAFMVLRRQRSRREVSLHSSLDWNGEIVPMDVIDSAAGPERVCCEQQRHALLKGAIHRLQPSLREALRARVEEELSVREIAHRCNISEAAAKSRLLRARKRLSRLCPSDVGPRVRGQIATGQLSESEST